MRCIPVLLAAVIFCSCTASKRSSAPGTSVAAAPTAINAKTTGNFNTNSTATRSRANTSFSKKESTKQVFSPDLTVPEVYKPIQFKYSILLDVPIESLGDMKLFSYIDEWYGTPYHFGGNSKSGIDCSAFTGNLMTSVYGISIPRTAKDQYQLSEHLSKDELSLGDLVFFHTTRKGISHVGIYLGNNKFVHASTNFGVTISDLGEGYYARSFRGGGRIRHEENTVAGN